MENPHAVSVHIRIVRQPDYDQPRSSKPDDQMSDPCVWALRRGNGSRRRSRRGRRRAREFNYKANNLTEAQKNAPADTWSLER